MAKGAEIKNVIMNFSDDIEKEKEEVERRACEAYAKFLCEMYPPQVIGKIIEKLELGDIDL